MFNLPKSTEFNRRIPKQKFYENLTISAEVKKAFVEEIRVIYWKNKIAETTVNVAAGGTVNEVEIFLISLNRPSVSESILRQIDKQIPYHILFVLEFEGRYQAWISYKEAKAGSDTFNVDRYYHTPWYNEDELILTVEGLNMDSVYDNFVRQIAGEDLCSDNDVSLKESVEKAKMKEKLQKEIDSLQAKIKKEKQLNRQMEMNARLKKLRKELEEIM